MALNYVYEGNSVKLPVSAGGVSGDPELVGDLAAVLLQDSDDSDEAVCALEGVFELSVTGADNAGDVAVSIGDKIYMDGGTLNKDGTDGTLFGYALDTVGSGSTATIPVKLKQ